MRSSKINTGLRWSRISIYIFVFIMVAYFVWIGSLLTHPRLQAVDSGVPKDSSGSIPQFVSETPDNQQAVPIKIDYSLHGTTPPPEIMNKLLMESIRNQPQTNADSTEFIPQSQLTTKTTNMPQFPPPIIFETPPTDSHAPAVLVVGGTDGSGTRRVVQILTELGVTMVSEDPETYDIHADLVGGWPEVVRPVIRETKSLQYDPNALSPSVKSPISKSLQRLLERVEQDSHKPTSHRLAVGGVLPKPKNIQVSKVLYGFKAPVAMTLSPWWAELLPHFKLVHVVRDGRDIAFSANQGPVEKFYNDMYLGNTNVKLTKQENINVKAIRLWSDWNSQLYNWAREYVHKFSTNNDKSFSYYAIHTEDIVSTNLAIKYAAINHLAKFVGSSLDDQQLCCLATRDSEFMGSHDRAQVKDKDADAQLASRYGKWKPKLDNNKQLREAIYEVGNMGLKIFGYSPLRTLADYSMGTENGFQCEVNEKLCEESDKAVKEAESIDLMGKTEDWAVQGMCTTHSGIDYKGEDISAYELPPGAPKTECCRKCRETPRCKHFTVDPTVSMCYLKSGNSVTQKNSKLISGDVI